MEADYIDKDTEEFEDEWEHCVSIFATLMLAWMSTQPQGTKFSISPVQVTTEDGMMVFGVSPTPHPPTPTETIH